jgi:hypothetical protein
MKIEFIKETKFDGADLYFTNVNGYYLAGSLSVKKEEAYKRYLIATKNNGTLPPQQEILEAITLEEEPKSE